MINSRGEPHNIENKEIVKISKDTIRLLFYNDRATIVKNGDNVKFSSFSLTSEAHLKTPKGVGEIDAAFLNQLNYGDIVTVQTDGTINVVYSVTSKNNLLFVTDFCNSKCVMCPQTQVEWQNHYYDEVLTILNLISNTPEYLCVSGGEPTVSKENYIKVISAIKKRYPKIALQILTNGKNFSDFNFTKECVKNSPFDTLYSIPIYSGNSELHDKIVGVKSSFESTIKGILNLYRFSQNIEIRIVITKMNYKDLENVVHFIYWNMPFVFRIAFMGMEVHGNANNNLKLIWIDPTEYQTNLERAITFLADRNMNVAIYNLPLCILHEKLRKYAKDSISEWKKTFVKTCSTCSAKNECAGFFATSSQMPNGIHCI